MPSRPGQVGQPTVAEARECLGPIVHAPSLVRRPCPRRQPATTLRLMPDSATSASVTTSIEGDVTVIRIDDGKANALSFEVIGGHVGGARPRRPSARRPSSCWAARASSPPASTSRS